MSYLSLTFAAFLLALLVVYAITPNKAKWVTLLVFSLIFYAASGLDRLAFVLGTSLVVYAASRGMQSVWRRFDEECAQKKLASAEKKALRQAYAAKSRRVLLLALVLCVGVLAWCKVGLKAVSLFNQLTGRSLALSILVPLGVSYYTFSSIGYLVDIHWRTVQAEKNYFKLLLCMIYFPHIVEGPIAKYEKLLPQLDKLTFPSYDRFCKGAQLALWGLFKKMVVADRLGIFVNSVFADVNAVYGSMFAVGLIFAEFQFYADFSGCMDLITGISDILGVGLEKNFNRPFLSRTVAEFWRRWHMSLFNWLKDYIYMPLLTSHGLGKLRKRIRKYCGTEMSKKIMAIIPTACVFLIIGLWHNVGIMYILHGLYWTVLFTLSSLFEDKIPALSERLRIHTDSFGFRCFQSIRTFALVAICNVTVLVNSPGAMLTVIKKILRWFCPWQLLDGTIYTYGLNRPNVTLAVLSIVLLLTVDIVQERCVIRDRIARCNIVLRWAVYFTGIFAIVIFGIYGPGYDAAAFIYQKF